VVAEEASKTILIMAVIKAQEEVVAVAQPGHSIILESVELLTPAPEAEDLDGTELEAVPEALGLLLFATLTLAASVQQAAL
jgi:hypothetical protein